MKYIRNISDEQNKVGDTDNVFRINLFEDTELFNFGTNTLTVNVANSSGYVMSLTPKKETGNTVIDLDFNDAPLKSLTPDDYLLEVEVKFPDGTTATFPTKGGMPFTVNGNLKETKGTLVPTVTFDNVLDAVDKKIAVYMDTVKIGPAGPVGPAGNVDTSHDNTFTGANKFTQLIDGALKTRQATFTDFAQVAADMNTYAGQWRVGTTPVANSPVTGMNYYIIEVVPDNSSTAGIIRVAQYGTGNYYYNIVNAGKLTGWHKIAQDETVVHNTGTETVAGDKTFTGNLFANRGIEVQGTLPYIDFHYNNDTGDYTSRIIETSKGTLSINGVNINGGTMSGTLNGNASSATKLAAPRNINGVGFDGTSDITIDPVTRVISSGADLFTLPNGFYLNGGTASTNKPAGASNYFGVEVIQTSYNGFMRLIDNNGLSFWTTKSSGSWGVWHQDADDSTVVHNSGNETIGGDKTFKSGNYGLRVTTAGIQKTSDNGATWTSI